MSPMQHSDLQHSAVVVIDMANDFVYPGGVIADAGGPEYQVRAQRIIEPLARLLAAARRAGVTVIYATDAHTPGDAELRKWPPHAMAGTKNAEIVSGLTPQPGDMVFGKQTYSPFLNPEFERALRERGITRLYITGLHTDCCARHASGGGSTPKSRPDPAQTERPPSGARASPTISAPIGKIVSSFTSHFTSLPS